MKKDSENKLIPWITMKRTYSKLYVSYDLSFFIVQIA